jgi:hypothetical protein
MQFRGKTFLWWRPCAGALGTYRGMNILLYFRGNVHPPFFFLLASSQQEEVYLQTPARGLGIICINLILPAIAVDY